MRSLRIERAGIVAGDDFRHACRYLSDSSHEVLRCRRSFETFTKENVPQQYNSHSRSARRFNTRSSYRGGRVTSQDPPGHYIGDAPERLSDRESTSVADGVARRCFRASPPSSTAPRDHRHVNAAENFAAFIIFVLAFVAFREKRLDAQCTRSHSVRRLYNAQAMQLSTTVYLNQCTQSLKGDDFLFFADASARISKRPSGS